MSLDKIELVILNELVNNEVFCRRVLPFIKAEYFSDDSEKTVFTKIFDYITKYDSLPSKEALLISLGNDRGLVELTEKTSKDIVDSFSKREYELKWLLDESEKWCKDRAIYLALMNSIKIADDVKGKYSRGSIPKLLTEALAVSFDQNVGHNYTEDSDSRFELYHRVEEKLAFDLDCMNRITKNGVPKKTLNVILAGTAVGKSLALCHMAASYFMAGKNVLYITLEMAEARIAERIDANLLNVTLQDLHNLSKPMYDKKIMFIKQKTVGKLIVKEYPTASASVTHFRSLLNELQLKKNFTPDVIFVDYLNIASSARITNSNNTNSYAYVKSIAEEFRGMAVEYDVPLWTATQTNRQGYTSSDIGLENTSESFGLPATADFMIALSTTDELEKMGQILVKQLKNRYNDISKMRRFVLGIDRSKMKLFDLDASAQSDLVDLDVTKKEPDSPLFDKSKFGNSMLAEKADLDDIKW